MEPLDPELRRLVHEGMVQAVPDQAREDRVLLGLLARLPQSGPPGGDGGGEGAGPPAMPEGAAAAAGKASIAAASKTWLYVVLGATTVAGAFMLGTPRAPEQPPIAAHRDAPAEPVSTTPRAPSDTRARSDTRATTTETKTTEAPASTPTIERTRERPSPSPRASSTASVERPRPEPAPDVPASAPDELAMEIEQIAAADRALARGEARRALELAREHASAHPHGQLGLEREAIELGARCQLAEPGAAEAAAAFLREHADAPAAAKVRTRCASERPE